MKISELIGCLDKIKTKYGDIECLSEIQPKYINITLFINIIHRNGKDEQVVNLTHTFYPNDEEVNENM
jgi:hypothetical protein